MGRKYVLLDDLTGEELSDDTSPLTLSLGRKSYRLYLSDKSLEALYAALEPFTKDAESGTATPAPAASNKADKERTAAIRAWAQANNVKQPNGKPLGDRGRIPDEIAKAYDEANA